MPPPPPPPTPPRHYASSSSTSRAEGKLSRNERLQRLQEIRSGTRSSYKVDEDVDIYKEVPDQAYRAEEHGKAFTSRKKRASSSSFFVDDEGRDVDDEDSETDASSNPKEKGSQKPSAEMSSITKAFQRAALRATLPSSSSVSSKGRGGDLPREKEAGFDPDTHKREIEEKDFMDDLLSGLKSNMSLRPSQKRARYSNPRETTSSFASLPSADSQEELLQSPPQPRVDHIPAPQPKVDHIPEPQLRVDHIPAPNATFKLPEPADPGASSFLNEADDINEQFAVDEQAPKNTSINAHAAFDEKNNVFLYLLDIVDTANTLALVGRLYVPQFDSTGSGIPSYPSCAVVVNGIMRNVFFLLRPGVTDDDVYDEIDKLRRSLGITRTITQIVNRNYAFEVPGIPASARWLKLQYSFTESPIPESITCGKTFSHVMGARSTPLELFVLKRKIMGPCWLRISKAQISDYGRASWCNVDLVIDDPKSIKVCQCAADDADDELAKRLPQNGPPLTLLAFSTRRVQNERGEQELFAVSLLTYSLPNGAEGAALPVSKLTLVRPPTRVPLPRIGGDAKTKIEYQRNESSLIAQMLQTIQQHDPDILCGHGIAGAETEFIVNRIRACTKTGSVEWSKLGRMRRTKYSGSQKTNTVVRLATGGRLILDTWIAARELAPQSKSFSLNALIETQLGQTRPEIDNRDIISLSRNAQGLKLILHHCFLDPFYAVKLMEHLNCLSLYKQLATLCGCLWSRTMVAGRAERNELFLLHNFHQKKYIVPDKYPSTASALNQNNKSFAKPSQTRSTPINDDSFEMDTADLEAALIEDHQTQSGAQGSSKAARRKPQYAGGLVLEPKRGFYDTFILLLDFNSLYPSIIQEYNICFTTVTRTKDDSLPNVPRTSGNMTGLLPRLIGSLVQRRRQTKQLMKSAKSPVEYAQYNIRQLALKLTANSMYGCLGFANSRFYCKQLAMLITSQGRDILQSTVDLANNNGMEVVYGDTDSIMVHTHTKDLSEVKALGRKLKELVNKRYRYLEIEMDGFFERMLLLKKKKYAALVATEQPDGSLTRKLEIKGLDLVRRDWCPLSQNVSGFVLKALMEGTGSKESVVEAIHAHLTQVATRVRSGEIELSDFIITKALTRPPREYTDSQPHVSVALQLEARGEQVLVGNTIPYIICVPSAYPSQSNLNVSSPPPPPPPPSHSGSEPRATQEAARAPPPPPSAQTTSLAAKARHPADVAASLGEIAVDIEWYLGTQILPPVVRLCAEIEGTSQSQLAHCLGLDVRKYASVLGSSGSGSAFGTQGGLGDIQPLEATMPDAQRFSECASLRLYCAACRTPFDMKSTFSVTSNSTEPGSVRLGWWCPRCGFRLPPGILGLQVYSAARAHVALYTQRWVVCDDPGCGDRFRGIGVYPSACRLAPKCTGWANFEYHPNKLNTQLTYFSALFDLERILRRSEAARHPKAPSSSKQEIVSDEVRVALQREATSMAAAAAAVARFTHLNARSRIDLNDLFSFTEKENE